MTIWREFYKLLSILGIYTYQIVITSTIYNCYNKVLLCMLSRVDCEIGWEINW